MKPVLCLLIFALTGCTTTHNFDVAVKNDTSHPITVGFVKAGPPFEPHWAAPEDYAMLPPSRQPTHWGQVIPQGKIMQIRIAGKFDRGSAAYLRIYLDEHTADHLLAISHGTGNRIDLGLHPGGDNRYVILLDDKGNLTAKLARLGSR
jgi:hypothetical protein